MAARDKLTPGLYLVATPIGNLEDITLRGVRVLKQADLIACEDTRQTQKLLNHYGIETPSISYHEHNEASRAAELIEKLEVGASIALVTDAGTPGISDPGFRIVQLAVGHGVPVVPVPGPAAFVAALIASGLPVEPFSLRGFLPPKSGARLQELEHIRNQAGTVVYYEAPHRIVAALQDIATILGANRKIVIARELTKIHEEFLRGTVAEVAQALKSRGEIKGEITLLISAGAATAVASASVSIRDLVEQIMKEEELDEKAALKKAAKQRGISKSEAYREWQRRPRQH